MKTTNRTTQLLVAFAITFLISSSFNIVLAETGQARFNGLTIALDTLRSTDTPQTILNFMKQYHYNELRIYMGWCSSFWTGNLNSPMKTTTQTFIDEICRLCAQNGFQVVCAVSAQVTPWKTYAPEEIQVGPNGEQNSQGNWVCPTGPKYQTFTRNLITTLTSIMEKHATPHISVDEIVFVTGSGRPTFYSSSMETAYYERTGKAIPTFTSTSGSYNTEQRQFIEFAKGTIRDLYLMMRDTAKAENPNTIFQALVDTYWVYPKTSYDTEPWDFYASSNLDEITYEWFYAIQNSNWAGITNGLQRIKSLNPTAKHYFIYGTSTMTTIENMRHAVQLAMNEGYNGVSLYEYAKSKTNPFDVNDIVQYTQQPSTPPNTPPNEFTLTIATTSGGTTEPVPGNYQLDKNTVYSVKAIPNSGYNLNWILDGVNVGSNNPLPVTIDKSHMLTAEFTTTPPPTSDYLFEDGFESGSTRNWSGTTTSSGDALRIGEYYPHHGDYDARFTTSGVNRGSENSYVYTNMEMQDVYARGYFQLASTTGSQILGDNGDRFYLIRFSNGAESLAMAGIRRESGVNKWVLYADGTYQTASRTISTNRWYSVELHWNAAQGTAEMFVDGTKILDLTVDNAINTSAERADFGIISATNVQNGLRVYGDCFRVANTYNGLEG